MKAEDRKVLATEIAKGSDISGLVAKLAPTKELSTKVVLYLDASKPGFVSACHGQIDPHTGACNNWLFDVPDPLGHIAGKLLLG